MMYDHEAWPSLSVDDLWIYDKLILSKKLGYVCGPASVPVPRPDWYVIRPITNLLGMGRGAKLDFINSTTDHIPPGHFWQQRFHGRHLSVDFYEGKQVRCTEGTKIDLVRFSKWCVVDEQPHIPPLIQDFIDRYQNVNVEMIDGNIIEVHIRNNPDFFDNPIEIIPVWQGQTVELKGEMSYIKDNDNGRVGLYKRYKD